MSAPAPEKQKLSEAHPNPVITFKSPGAKVEVRLKVFSQEFHVSSAALKLNSGFFRISLDPSGGKSPTSTKVGFTSESFTKVNDDGTWALSPYCVVGLQFSSFV